MDENVWTGISSDVVDSPKHRQLALQMARETMTLLQNNNNILPLSKQAKIALIGPNANDSVMQWGNYNGLHSHTILCLKVCSVICQLLILFMSRFADTRIVLCSLAYSTNVLLRKETVFIQHIGIIIPLQGSCYGSSAIHPFLFNTNGAAPFAPGVI